MLNLIKKILSPKRALTDSDKERLDQERRERALKIKKLISSPEWKAYTFLIDDYIEKSLVRKVQARLDIIDDKGLDNLRLADREIMILKWVKEAPMEYVKKIEEGLKK